VYARGEAIRAAGRWRTIRALDGGGPRFTLEDGREVVSFASNDYLGLTRHPAVRDAARAAVEQWGTGSGASRLVVGDRPVHRALEHELARWKHAEAALLFPTGFAANLGVITTFGSSDVLVISDDLNHASIIDGCRLSSGRVAIARHRDVDHVRDLLGDHAPAIVVTDAVFSMDGDVAPLDDLVDVCAAAGALLIVDEAHQVLGSWAPPDGADVIRVGTMSKTLGSVGGFVVGPRPFVDLVVNVARSFIFTTAPAPADAAAALAAVQLLQTDEGNDLVARLRSHVDRIVSDHPSPIIPVIIGAEDAALAASQRLLDDHGLLVPAIRPPTVAPGTSRLRVALSAAHDDDDVERLGKALADLGA
jgi:8-amino-7-oxononanoate synthase